MRERCGWLGDGHAIAQLLLTRYDAASFLHKYARDIETGGRRSTDEPRVGPVYGTTVREPKPAGVPHMIAPGKRLCNAASPDWGSAQVFIPWEICTQTGDMRILQEFLEPMRTWVGYLGSIADPRTGLPVTGLGDWCSPSMRQAAESGTPWIGNAEIPILTSGMYIRCCRILAQTEELVGDPSRSQYYRQLADSLSRRLTERYFLPPHERPNTARRRSHSPITTAIRRFFRGRKSSKNSSPCATKAAASTRASSVPHRCCTYSPPRVTATSPAAC